MTQTTSQQATLDQALYRGLDKPRPDVQGKRSANVGPGERALSTAVGVTLGAVGIALRRNPIGWLAAAVGAGLLFHGAKRHSFLYDLLGVTDEDATARAHPLSRQIHVRRRITINRPVPELYQFWRNLENLPKFMVFIENVTPIGENRSRWTARFPVVGRMEWESQITEERENERIAWRVVNAVAFEQRGAVTFKPAPHNLGTEVGVEMVFRFRGGAVGAALAKALGGDPDTIAFKNLHNFKQLMETGEVATNAGPSCRQQAREQD